MIKTKADLKYYLEQTKIAYGIQKRSFLKGLILRWLFPDNNYEFMVNLRKLEFWLSQRGGGATFMRYYRHWRHAQLRAKTGVELNPFCAEEGLHVSHGKIVVSSCAKIGKRCKILSDVTIGGHGRYDIGGAPILGDRVFVASGARIIGNVHIADGVVIGANAVVIKDIVEPNTTWAGIPARKVSDSGSNLYLRKQFRE
jgi:serine O-acetyltransferase